MTECYVGIGANLGDPLGNVQRAAEELQRLPAVEGMTISSLYETLPVGGLPQPKFVNAVCRFWCALPPKILFEKMEEIERRLGKRPKGKEEPRPIDLDLLFYGNQRVKEGSLEVPHRAWHERLFVLIPLAELLGLSLEAAGVRRMGCL